jgi:3-oxoacyl-[acyl-carrier protein] reductase
MKVALVTGASRGIGRSIAVELARLGVFVFINYTSNKEAAEETKRLCRSVGGDGEYLAFDVANITSVEEALDEIKSQKGRLDILVNNAGVTLNGLLLRAKPEEWARVLEVNLFGTMNCAKSALKLILKSDAGRIINLSSVVAEMGNPGQTAYVASKAGIIGFTKSLALELASRQVTVNAVTPGFIETDMTDDLPEERKKEMLSRIPLGRLGRPEDVAALIGFLAVGSTNYITGQVIGVNGGLYM